VKQFFAGLLAIVFVLPSIHGEIPPRWTDQFEQAYGVLQSGDLADATRRFDILWKSFDEEPELAFAIGTALDSTGHHREATDWYWKALKLNPRFGPACNNLALNYVSQEEFERALPLLRKATQLDPRNEQAFYNLGLVNLRLKRYREAARALLQAHNLKPNEHDPLLRLAYASFMGGQEEEGMRAIETLLRLPGDVRETAFQAVRILNAGGLYRAALETVRKAEEASAGSQRLSFEEADARFHLGDYKQAAGVLLKSGAPSESDLDYYLLLGSAQGLSADLPGAVKSLQAAARITPTEPEPYYRLAMVFLLGFRDQDASEVLTEGLRLIPNSPLLLFAQGVVEEVAGRYHQAIEYLQKSVEAKHDQPAVWSVLGDLYVRLGQYPQGAEAYNLAIHQGASSETAVKYADLLTHLQRFAEAQKLLQQVAKDHPGQVQVYLTLGKLYNAQKLYTQAERVLRQAVELDANDADAHAVLSSALQHLGRLEEARREGELAVQKRALAHQRERSALLRAALVPQTTASEPGAGPEVGQH
jgi:tetratricopeptide (TPR) repeat protein